jgi:hypothetical protein
MKELRPLAMPINPPCEKNENPPWQRIYRFALAAWIFAMLSLALTATGFLSGCGGGGSSSGSGSSDVVNSLSEYVLPGELSAVPASKEEDLDSSSVTSVKTVTVGKLGHSSFSNLAKAFSDADTDYTEAIAHKFVEEPALEQFSVLEDVLTALNQTKYYEEIGEPAYKAMVTMVGGGNEGKEQKSLEPWVVESDIVDADGNVVEPDNAASGGDYDVRVRAWIEEGDRLVRGQFIISEPAEQDDDGAYTNYGTWTLNVSFDDSGEEFFAASCSVDAEGQSIIKLHETMGPEGPGSGESMLTEVKAIMHRSETEGYGKVQYPDWEAIHGPGADPNITKIPTVSAQYAYNEDYLALQEEEDSPIYKDRNSVVEMTHQYGVFRYDNGNDLMKSKQFGFPFYYVDETEGYTRYGYYGAWQGRHQIWMDMGEEQGSMADLEDVEVTRENHGSDAEPETYTIGKTFNGTLVKRAYVDATLDDIKNIPVEIWVNKDYQLIWMDAGSGDDWYWCKNITWDQYGPSCDSSDAIHFDTQIGNESLIVGSEDDRKHVHINGWDETNQLPKEFVYLTANTIGTHDAGFYEAQRNQEGRLSAEIPLTVINTSNVTELWIWIGGSLWVEYKGAADGWVEKEVVGFDERSWMPEFGTNNNPYILPSNNELYINMQGACYVVRKDNNGNVTVKLELQTTLNPENAETLLPSGTVLKDPWDTEGTNSTYEFIVDPTSPKYLMLVYKTIGQNDQDQNGSSEYSAGDIVENGMWGLETTDNVGFNWEYSGDGGWGSVTYLMDENDDYVLLDDPVRFQSLEITHNGSTKTLGLQYDGWMMGLPDLYWELERNDWEMTDDIKNKIINLPAGTELTSVDNVEYVLKPLEISQFLLPATGVDESLLPDLSQADSVDLTTVPDYEAHGMGDMPSDPELKYSEGILVE